MAKAIVLLSALCFLAFATIAHSQFKPFHVEGRVYCDPCRVHFTHKLATNIGGALVRLTCKNIETEKETFSAENTTDIDGKYMFTVDGDHSSDICEVTALSSPKEDCKEPFDSSTLDKSRIECSGDTGIHDHEIRYANPIGFASKEAIDGCNAMLEELDIEPIDVQV